MSTVLLAEAERLLALHSPAEFDTSVAAFPECSEYVRGVEDEEAWKAGYDSLDAFYGTHEARHPDIRLYAEDVRRIEGSDIFRNPWGGLPSERLARLRKESEAG